MTLMEPAGVDVVELRSLVDRLERLVGPSPLAATDADGFPTNVASGELIESAWGTATATKLREAPRGNIQRLIKSSDEAGFGSTEYAISGLSSTTPATTGRMYEVSFAIRVAVTTPGAVDTLITIALRTGTVAGAVAGLPWNFAFPQGVTTYGVDLIGTSYPAQLTPSTAFVYTISTNGLGRMTVKLNSWCALKDIT